VEKAIRNLREWVGAHLDCAPDSLNMDLIAGDASPRSYFRVSLSRHKRVNRPANMIVVKSPPSENNRAFLSVGDLLSSAGIRTPRVAASSVEQGFFLLEDFGDQVLLENLRGQTNVNPYRRSIEVMLAMTKVDTSGLSIYSEAKLRSELELFPEWFLRRLLNLSFRGAPLKLFNSLSEIIIAAALEQPAIFVHRDFHSRNLMVLDSGELGVIDFQDAVVGPMTYDPVSLLKDCYIRWPREQQLLWLRIYFEQLPEELRVQIETLPPASGAGVQSSLQALKGLGGFARFCRWFDLMGLQRHLKVLGVFARLYLRDGKPDYLQHLSLVAEYVREVLRLYSDQSEPIGLFERWFEEELVPALSKHHWHRSLQGMGWKP
jgi:aminoglycoside/choline kinase family phosphotransferase